MADLLNTVSSFFEKLKLRKAPPPESTHVARPEKTATPESRLNSLGSLGSMNENQLKEFVSQQPEKTVVRALQTLTDSELQVRIIQVITDESTLKRVTRSELSKKIKRAAEKRLRDIGVGTVELKHHKLARITGKLEDFFAHPQWLDAPELLLLASDPTLVDEPGPHFAHFETLRRRLQAALEEYEKTCAEMTEIFKRLDPSQPHSFLSKSALHQLQNRWEELETKYSFPKTFDLISKYHLIRSELRAAPAAPLKPRDPTPPHPSLAPVIQAKTPDENEIRKRQELKDQREKKDLAERQKRLNAVENLLERLREVSQNLAQRQAGPKLRELQNEVATLRRWKREYPVQLEEAESLLKSLSVKRTEVIQEAQWDSWARTDLAIRIQTELEKTIGEIEAELDEDAAIKKSSGLGERLYEYAKQMRELGSLDRSKDHKIWEQFKALSTRGWLICDKMRALLLEQLKTALSMQAAKEIEFTATTLAQPRATLDLKLSAFEDPASSRIKELQTLWREVGAKPSESNREVETVGAKLFELYFRQFNLHFGKLKRVEADATQKKREILDEMKLACEGKSSLLARVRVAKAFEEKWKKAPLPDTVASDFQTEFEGYQSRLIAELEQESEKSAVVAAGLLTQAESILEKILEKNGANLAQTLKTVSALESELQELEKYLAQFVGLKPSLAQPRESTEPTAKRFQEIGERLRTIFQECRTAAGKEITDRARERDQVMIEAEELALSQEWDSSGARFEELASLWKKVGTLGQSQDSLYTLVFENIRQFYLTRALSKDLNPTPEQKEKCLKARKELLYSLDALTRFQERKTEAKVETAALELPFTAEERAKASGKTLELGLKYKQILALDPKGGILKETKKVMEQWSKLGTTDDEFLPDCWRYYLDRIHKLLEIQVVRK